MDRRPAPLAAKAPAPSTAGAVPADLARVLEEVDSYVSLGFVDDAKEALREVSTRFPNHPALAKKIAELGLELEEAPPEIEEPAPTMGGRDLAAELDLGAPALASDDPLGDLAGDAPPPATASAAADDPFGEGAGFEVPVYDETPAGEALLSMGAGRLVLSP